MPTSVASITDLADLNEYVTGCRPAILVGFCAGWPATRLWDLSAGGADRLTSLAGSASVEVMVADGTHGLNGSPLFYGDLDRRVSAATTLSDLLAAPADSRPLYLAQAPLLPATGAAPAALAPLWADLPANLPGLPGGTHALTAANLWLARCATRSSLHYDPSHNILAVLAGAKRLALYPPSAAAAVGVRPVGGDDSNHAALVDWSWAGGPPAQPGTPSPTVVDVSAGDALFLPEGWFHAVSSAPNTVAINCWWRSPRAVAAAASPAHQAAFGARAGLESLVESLTAEALTAVPPWKFGAEHEPEFSAGDSAWAINHGLCPWEAEAAHALASGVPGQVPAAVERLFASGCLPPASLRRVLAALAAGAPGALQSLWGRLSPCGAVLLSHRLEEADAGSPSPDATAAFYGALYGGGGGAATALLRGRDAFAAMMMRRALVVLGITGMAGDDNDTPDDIDAG